MGKKNRLIIITILLALILIFPVNIYLSNNWVQVNMYTLYPDKLPTEFENYNILQISDMHIKTSKDLEKDLIKMAENKLSNLGKHLDCIVLTGDLLNYGTEVPELISYLAKYTDKYPVFFTAGNHEYAGNLEEFEDKLSQIGVKVLENQAYKLNKGDSNIWLVGVSDYMSNKNNEEEAFQSVSANDFNIVITHSPNNFSTIVKYGGKLVLCGHTHGGQIKIPFVPVFFVTGQGFFPKYSYGFYTEDRPDNGKALMYITKGTGYTSLLSIKGFRFFNRPEIAIFNLQ